MRTASFLPCIRLSKSAGGSAFSTVTELIHCQRPKQCVTISVTRDCWQILWSWALYCCLCFFSVASYPALKVKCNGIGPGLILTRNKDYNRNNHNPKFYMISLQHRQYIRRWKWPFFFALQTERFGETSENCRNWISWRHNWWASRSEQRANTTKHGCFYCSSCSKSMEWALLPFRRWEML